MYQHEIQLLIGLSTIQALNKYHLNVETDSTISEKIISNMYQPKSLVTTTNLSRI